MYESYFISGNAIAWKMTDVHCSAKWAKTNSPTGCSARIKLDSNVAVV